MIHTNKRMIILFLVWQAASHKARFHLKETEEILINARKREERDETNCNILSCSRENLTETKGSQASRGEKEKKGDHPLYSMTHKTLYLGNRIS